jgi:hypothetical protein
MALNNYPKKDFTMTLGTAQRVMETIDQGWSASKIAEARRAIAYWKALGIARAKRAAASNAQATKGA